MSKHLKISIPGKNSAGTVMPSTAIHNALVKGASLLEDVCLRFDWAHCDIAPSTLSIISLPAIKSCRLLNSTFCIVGVHLTCLCIAAEDNAFRHDIATLKRVLGACDNIQDLALQMAIGSDMDVSSEQKAAHLKVLKLQYLHVCDTFIHWNSLQMELEYPAWTRVHLDLIAEIGARGEYSREALIESCLAGGQTAIIKGIGLTKHAAAMHILKDAKHPHRWPEYISLSFGNSIEQALAFKSMNAGPSSGSFTVQNGALSLERHRPPGLGLSPGIMLECVIAFFIESSAGLGLNGVTTLAIDATGNQSSPSRWNEVLRSFPHLTSMDIHGITSCNTPVLLGLAQTLGTRLSQHSVQYHGPHLQQIRIPHFDADTLCRLVPLLEARMFARHVIGTKKITWSGRK